MMRLIVCVCVFVCASPALAQYAKSFPRVLLPLENSVCRVTTIDASAASGARSHGSGVLIEPINNRSGTYVLTAYHVIRDRNRHQDVLVSWDGQQQFRFTVAAARPGCDGAILKLCEGQTIPSTIPKCKIAAKDISIGELAFGFGFGSSGTLRCSGGKALEYNSTVRGDRVWFTFAGRFRQGDSGGPIFVVRDGKPVVIGVGWGSSYDQQRGHWTVTAGRLNVLRRMFALEKAPIHPHQGGTRAIAISGSGSS